MSKIKKALASLGIAGVLAAGFTAAPVISADLGVGGVAKAEAYTTSSCHSHRPASWAPLFTYCYVDWNWAEETFQWKRDGWHERRTVYSNGKYSYYYAYKGYHYPSVFDY